MPKYYLSLASRLAALAVALLLIATAAIADDLVFTENFDDGDWTANPTWEPVPADPSISISTTHSASAPCSFKVDAANNTGAIRTPSGLSSVQQSFTATFSLYIESIAEQAIPWCLRNDTNSIAAIIFLYPNGRVQLAQYAGGVWTRSEVPTATSYNQWHSFRITYNGAATRLYIDNHATPDATVNQPLAFAPTQLYAGNFSAAHTGTIYVDDLTITASPPPPPPTPGRVYVQFCSDTSTGGLNESNYYNTFPVNDESYVSPAGQAAQVMAPSWRDSHRDSLGNPIKLTWYMLCGGLYSYGTTTGPIFPYELMMDNHGAAIAQHGDEMAYHYHTWVWNGAEWVQAAEFTPCQPDFEQTVAHFVLDRGFYPCSFRAGWNWMSNLWECYLDEWYPYRFEGSTPAGTWTPYHPSAANWKVIGALRGWEAYYRYTTTFAQSSVDAAFAAALAGADQVVTLYSHLQESDFVTKIDSVHGMFAAAHAKYPTVEFEYVTAREAMMKWRKGADVAPPVVSVSTSDAEGVRTAIISTSEDIYQQQPFIALRRMDGTYSRIDCAALGGNRWQVAYSIADTAMISAAVTDWFGNAAVKDLPVTFRIYDVSVTRSATSLEATWQTNQPADSQVTYRTMPSGEAQALSDPALLTRHHMTIAGLQPGQVYELDISSVNAQGERATAKSVYVLTDAAPGVVVDNVDAGFTVTGTWTTGTTAAGRYGNDYRVCAVSPNGASYANWVWQAPADGIYRVSVWWSQGGNRSADATYSVIIGSDEYPKIVNQQTMGGQWNVHGLYYVEAGQTVTVRLHNKANTGTYVIADAVSFEVARVALPGISLGRLIGDGSGISLPPATVTAVFADCYYIQEQTGLPGIKVIGVGVTEGQTVQVSGVLSTLNSERVITDPWVR